MAADIMVRSVVTATPDTPFHELAAAMAAHRIGALPVVQSGKVVGIVTETDLLRRAGSETEAPRHSRWSDFFADPAARAAEYARTHGRTAQHVMSRNVVTVQADTPLSDIARLMETHHIKRVPVLLNGELVGIVSRANLVQAVASQPTPAPGERTDDRQIRDALLAELRRQPWAVSGAHYNIVVDQGVVHLWGMVGSAAEREATVVAAENTKGVQKVEDHLRIGGYLGV